MRGLLGVGKYSKYYSAKRRAIYAAGESINHLEIFERDKWVCGICTEPVDKRLRGDNWMRATLDHIIPLCQGGQHTKTNVQCSHWKCNMSKGGQLLAGSV